MQICLLLEKKLKPIPESIKMIFDAGNIEIVIRDDVNNLISGDHVILEGNPADFIKWLKPFSPIYVGTGIMQEQRFRVSCIKES